MATKLQLYQAVADRTVGELTARSGNWLQFLDTAARLYKYPFHDQMMIYAQKPDVTACAELELWNEQFNRWVRRGAKGIALIDDSGSYPRLKYVFDVSDTEPSLYRARPVQLWEMRQKHKTAVLSELAKNYEDIDADGTLADAFHSIARQLASEYYEDNHREIAFRSENSILEPVYYNDGAGTPLEQADDTALSAEFIDAVSASVAYTLMTRCELDAAEYFDEDDFRHIIDFNTPDMVHALGVASAELSGQVLRDIEITIRKYERRLESVRASALDTHERSEQNYDRNPYLHAERGLSSPGHHAERTADERSGADRTLGQNEESVPERTPEDNVQPSADLGETVPASEGSGRGGESEVRADNELTGGADGSAGQGDGAGRVDGGDEHSESAGDGSDSQRIDLYGLELSDTGAVDETAPLSSDETEPPQALSQIETRSISEILSTSPITLDEVDFILRDGGNFDDHKLDIIPTESRSALRIAAYFAKYLGLDSNAEFLKGEYLRGRYGHKNSESGKGFDFGNHRVCAWFTEEGIELAIGITAKNNIHKVLLPWESAATRINELLREGRYVSPIGYNAALDNERRERADDLWFFYRDDMHNIPDEWNAERGGHPEDVAKIKSLLEDDNERQAIFDRVEADVYTWLNNDDRERSWHDPLRLLGRMEALMQPPVIVPGDGSVPEKNFSYFITQDEIDALLTHGGVYSEGKYRFLSFLLNDHDAKEKEKFFKDQYGHGGGTWGYTNGWHNAEPGKGVNIQRGTLGSPSAEVNLKWPAVIKRTEQLIQGGLYMTRAERDRIPNYERLILVRNINNFFGNLPEDYERPFPGKTDYSNQEYRNESGEKTLDFFYPHEAEWEAVRGLLDNPERVDTILSQMRQILENTSEDDRYYDIRKTAFEHLTEHQNGTYTLFPGLENLPDPDVHKIVPSSTPRQEYIEDLRESRIGEPNAGESPRGVQMSLFDTANDSPLPILPSVEEQRTKIDQTLQQEAAEVQAAFSLERDNTNTLLLDISDDDKKRIVEQFANNPRSREAVNLVKEIYGDTLTTSLPQAVKRIAELIAEGKFSLTARNIQEQIREELSARGFVVSDELIEEGINEYGSPDAHFQDYADFIEREYLTEEPDLEEPNEQNIAAQEQKQQTQARTYQVGDTVWLDGRKFIVDTIGDYYKQHDDLDRRFSTFGYNVTLTDITSGYPLSRSMYSAEIDYALELDERNAYLSPMGETTAEITDPAPETESVSEPAPPPDFASVAQKVYDRVIADEDYAYHLQFAQSRSALRNPLNTALDKVIAELLEAEPSVYGDYFNDDIGDSLFDFVYRQSWENRPMKETVNEPPVLEGFTEITGQAQSEPVISVDNISRNNFNMFALAFPRLIDGTYQSMRYRDANSRELSVSYANTNADIISLDVSYTKPDGHTAYAPLFQFRLNHEQRMLTPIVYANDDTGEDVGLLTVATDKQIADLGVKAYEFIRSININGLTHERSDVFLDENGNPLPAEPKADTTAFLKERADREADAWGRVQSSMFAPVQEPELKRAPAANFCITDDHLGEGGAKVKFRNNIKALQTLKDIETDKRSATPEEQEILSRYIGWGGLPQAFDPDNKDWANEYQELNALLTPDEYASARASTLNAHYTSPIVIKAIWDTIERIGFMNGNVLEPSMGIGNFYGLLPDSMRGSKLYGVELDSVTARIAALLYPKANIQQTGFEKTEFSDAFFDLAIGNVPFGQYGVADKRYDKHSFSIHNYFFAKALDKVRPGGVVAFVTSKYTMDERNPKVRKYLAERAELLGAVRLPNNTFLKNAGTETTMDILFLQKRDRPLDIEPDWVHLGMTDDGIPINRYFLDNPETVCGIMALDERMNNKYGRDDMTACLPIEGADLGEQLKAALLSVQGTFAVDELDDLDGVDNHAIPADFSVKNFSYAIVDDKVYFRENSLMYPVDLPATTLERIKGMIQLRTCVQKLIDLQLDDYASDHEIKDQQQELNDLYDSFIAEFGLISNQANNRAFNADSAYYLLSSLEIINEDGELERKADMFTKRTIKQKTVITHVDTASEALAVSIGEKAYVDLDYMSSLTGFSQEKLLDDLRGVVFLNVGLADTPEKTYVTADEYLSGNVRNKLRLAEAAAISLPSLAINVEALKAAMPKDLEAGDISVRLGATWIEPKYIQEFMYELFDTSYYNKKVYQVQYHAYTGEWQVTGKGKTQFSDIVSTETYGTDRMNAYQILDDTLNLRDVRVYDHTTDADGRERRVLNKKATMLAQQKQELIKQTFKDWIWKDPERRQTLVKEYNEKFNSVRPREYDGSHIIFSGINPEIKLGKHQVDGVARHLYGGNALYAHVVGAGKTFTMIAAAMESKRLGQCQKSLFAVPNHLTEQWAAEFLRLYPSANILVATKRDFEIRNRKKFCAKIATGDYDAVIIGHSQHEKIPMSRERQERLLNDQLWEIEEGIRELKANNGERFSIKQLEKTKRSIEARLNKLLDGKKRDDVVTFEQLGCDRLYVDEAHYYKNLFLYTKMRNVAGLSTSEAQKSSDLFMKCRYLDELTGNKGVLFASGTPISNSMTEMFTMQRYLQHDRLNAMSLLHFDAWASIFGETQTSIELAPEGTGYRARTRFAKFHNLPELMCLFKEVADIQTADMLNLPVPEAKFENIIVEPSEMQKDMVQELSERAAMVHARLVEPTVDNMLKITTDGRKIGLDQRLMNPLLEDFEGSKVNACTDKVFGIWQDTSKDKLTQLVFCDFSTPNKDGRFNVYDDIRAKLIERGIPEHEIAFIHDADTETRKKELFAKVRQGKVRVLFGSTFKMGAGTNVQDRLVAIHDADCPWRPADLEQRAGRIIRQGNKNAEVRIFRYATSGTFVLY